MKLLNNNRLNKIRSKTEIIFVFTPYSATKLVSVCRKFWMKHPIKTLKEDLKQNKRTFLFFEMVSRYVCQIDRYFWILKSLDTCLSLGRPGGGARCRGHIKVSIHEKFSDLRCTNFCTLPPSLQHPTSAGLKSFGNLRCLNSICQQNTWDNVRFWHNMAGTSNQAVSASQIGSSGD